MKNGLSSIYRQLAKTFVGLVIVVAIFITSGFAKSVSAQEFIPPGPYPCGTMGVQMECHTYDVLNEMLIKNVEKSLQMQVVFAISDAFTYFTQQLAIRFANWTIAGASGQSTAYYEEGWGEFLFNTAKGAGAQFITEMSNYTDEQWGFNVCKPISLDLKISLANIATQPILPPKDCSWDTIIDNFETMSQGLEPSDLGNALLNSLNPGSNQMGITIVANQKFINKQLAALQGNTKEREEGGGFKAMTSPISLKISTPSEVIKNWIQTSDPMKAVLTQQQNQYDAMVQSALAAGALQLPQIFATTFISTLASAGINALFDNIRGVRIGGDTEIDLTNPEAQGGAGAGGGTWATVVTDVMVPNLVSNDRQDFTFELSSCTEPRGLWGCSLDDGMASVLKAVNESGGYTIARAAGIGNAPAGSPIFLHKDWELIPESETKDNQDSGCYQRAYCASNLAKLRFARIISVGWELAANSAFNKKENGRYVTLEEVVRGYNDCSADGKLDAEHPWCHLIDPSWVLTAPQFRCRVKGYGETLLGSGLVQPIRFQECSDVISCLKQSDKGECVGGYGYCLSEKTAWRFGADACYERYVSCRTYKTRDKSKILTDGNQNDATTGPEVSYIRNSIDYGSCNADNVGCMFYSTVRDTSTTTTGKWLGEITSSMAVSGTRIYFDASAEPCEANDDGCTKVLTREQGVSSLNLVKNGSFEDTDKDDATKLIGWDAGKFKFNAFKAEQGDSTYQDAQSADFTDHATLSFKEEPSIKQQVRIEPLRNYVMSFYVRKGNGSGEGTVQLSVHLFRVDGNTAVATTGNYYRSKNCNLIGVPENDQASPAVGGNPTNDWQRYTCEFASTKDSYYGIVEIRGENAAIDAVQLEEGDNATPFIDGLNTDLDVKHIKLPPEEFGCQGDKKTDRKECEDFARMCKQADDGCQGYTEVGGESTEIPAKLGGQDYCPNVCVGYAEYLKLPSSFDLVKNETQDYLNDPEDEPPAYFIPSSAAQCSAGSAGCEEFTNMEAQSQGGEQKLYANYIRACLNPSKPENKDLTKTYFTWEGSDITGYQLRTWSLIQKSSAGDDTNDVPEYKYDSTLATNAPKILRKAGPDGLVKDPATCNADSWKLGADPDCRQIYDESGRVYYRYFSQTILSTTDCLDYRKDNANFNDCTKTGGTFRQENNECLYHINVAQSFMCSAANAGCRGYIGTTGRNIASVFEEDFKSGSSTKFLARDEYTDAIISNEALQVGDYSLKVAKSSSNTGQPIGTAATFESTTNTLYNVSFWAKSTEAKPKEPVTLTVDGITIGTFFLKADWQRFEIGPFRVTDGKTTSTMTWVNLPHISFLDQVLITKLQDVVYVKKNSWVIPGVCDQTVEGIPQEQAMVGCREYSDRNNKIVDVRQFSNLCRYENVGCTGFVDTRNSNDPYEQTFTLSGLDATKLSKPWDMLYAGTVTNVRPADRFIYAIDDRSVECAETADSCRAFGKPKLDAYQKLDAKQPFETVYLKDDITKYQDTGGEPKLLCRPDELFCDRYKGIPKTSPSITSYFRDPLNHVCEWKDKVVLKETLVYPKGEYSGWFIKDKEPAEPCYPGSLSKANTFLFEYAGTSKYQGWTAACPADQAECTEYRDVNDRTDQAHPLGRSYFYIDNNKLDKATCAGKVDPLGGCVLFRDMNNSELTYSTIASYAKSHAENDNAVAPVNCEQDADNPFCKSESVCKNVTCAGVFCLTPTSKNKVLIKQGASCKTDADCNEEIAGDIPSTMTDETTRITGTCGSKGAGVCLDVKCGGLGCAILGSNRVIAKQGSSCYSNDDCKEDFGTSLTNSGHITGRCQVNDANLVLKVKLDRDCVTWLGCSTAETVYDPSQAQYVDLCNELSVCDQSLGATGKDFCAHYVDRTREAPKPKYGQGFYEPVLRVGQFFDITSYASRPVGFGVTDYSGYALPNHFQVADLVTRRVAYEILEARPGDLRNKFALDYRLAAAIPMYSMSDSLAEKIDDPVNKDLHLCRYKRTGQIGYYVADEYKVEQYFQGNCYLAIESPYVKNVTLALFGSAGHPNDVTKLVQYFEQLEQPEFDQKLSVAFPSPECKAYPDSMSPFPNYYVKQWDVTKDPPQPKEFVGGYDKVSYCEKGEDCACSYRKVSYASGAKIKYYSMYGEAPPVGICSGGTRDGESCIPDASPSTSGVAGHTPDPAVPGDVATRGSEPGGTDAGQMCGGNGICQPINTVSFVRGMYGQCLQRDASRIIAGTQERNPCMTWNPSPVLFGKNDVYHYQPTAGYLPPQNSGEYYCVADANQPTNVNIPAEWMDPAGKNVTLFYYDEDYVSEGGSLPTDEGGLTGALLDGSSPKGGDMGSWCEDADDDQDNGMGSNLSVVPVPIGGALVPTAVAEEHRVDYMAGRWITTGRGASRNYAEYFIPFINEGNWTEALYPGMSGDQGKVQKSLLERNFAFFSFSPIRNPNGNGDLGCTMAPEWVDGVTVSDYDDVDSVKEAQKVFDAGFRQNFKGTMTRDSAGFVANLDNTRLIKAPCVHSENNPEATGCFYKYWELNYRAEGQQKFIMLDREDSGLTSFKTAPFYGQSEANKSYFAIRAMFEDINPDDNVQDALDTEKTPVNGASLSGPFRFVGFWVTAAVPGTISERALYMYLTIGHADICKQVAQVIAPDTREAAAFNDRVYENGGFSLPLLGYIYSSVNTPFGAAMHTKVIGKDPLFQIVGKMPGSKSKLKPPTFIAAGQQYSIPGNKFITGRWTLLSNLFAKIYRVYRYYDNPVTEESGVCYDGPNPNSFCPITGVKGHNEYGDEHNTNNNGAADISKKYCGWGGICVKNPVIASVEYGNCNALSGVNAGLPCSSDDSDTPSGNLYGYHVCHNAPMRLLADGELSPQYVACEVNSNWDYEENNNTYYECNIPTQRGNEGCMPHSEAEAIKLGAFRCAQGAVELDVPWNGSSKIKCNKIEAESRDCPHMVVGDHKYLDVDQDPLPFQKYIHSGCDTSKQVCLNGFGHAQCNTDSDCEFTSKEYWGSYRANKPWGGADLSYMDQENGDVNWAGLISNGYGIRPSQWFVYDGYSVLGYNSPQDFEALFNTDYAYKGTPSVKSQTDFSGLDTWDWTYMWYGFDKDKTYPDNMVTAGDTWWTTHNSIASSPQTLVFSSTDIASKDLSGGGFQRIQYPVSGSVTQGGSYYYGLNMPSSDAIQELNRFPGAYAGVIATDHLYGDSESGQYGLFIPGHCEVGLSAAATDLGVEMGKGSISPVASGSDTEDQAELDSVARAIQNDKPYAEISWFCQDEADLIWNTDSQSWSCAEMTGAVYDCDCDTDITAGDDHEWHIYRRFFGATIWEIGMCDGGERDGEPCSMGNGDKDCQPEDLTTEKEKASETYCVSAKNPTYCPIDKNCEKTNDLDNDCNPCTHNAGYFPRGDLCGGDPTKPQCLTGYKLLDINNSAASTASPPTDVSYGLYTPDYLLNNQKIKPNYLYSAYYIPQPPRVAAPDMTRGCPAAGQCPVTQWDTFSFENQSEGMVAAVGGQSMDTIRFYGWAADNQGGLKDMWVDWGDSTVQEYHEVKMKNKKPFCNIGKECEFVPGLTCNTDADCPPAGGRCRDIGFCQAKPASACSSDMDCDQVLKDKCVKHVPFGNTDMACEQNYFEFTHVYACGKENNDPAVMPKCGDQKYCSRENVRPCSIDNDCGVGDKCLDGLAPPGGCYDEAKSACRFTPRILLKDNWGWCTGECRRKNLGGGKLDIGEIGSEDVMFKNGGCYDGTQLTSNMDSTEQIIKTNYCDPNTEEYLKTSSIFQMPKKWVRPWIVFKGALQLGVGQ